MSHVLCESEDRYGESGGDADDAYQRGVPTPRNHSHYTSNNNNSNTNKNEAHDDDDDDESTSSWESFDEDEGNIDGGDTAAPHHHLHGDVDELYEDDNDDDDDIVDGVAEEEEEYEEDDDDDAEWSSLSSGEVQIADPPTKPSQQAQTSSPRVAQPQTAAAPDAHTSSGAAAAGNTTLSELLEDDVDADTIFILELALQLYLTEEGIHLRNIHSCLARLSLQAPPGFDVKSYFAAGSGEQSPTHIPPNMLLQPELWLHLVQDLLRLTGNPLNGEGLRRDHSSTLMSDGQTHASTLQPNERTNTTAPDDGHSELTDGGVGGGAGAATTPRDAAHRAFLAAYQRDLSNSARHHEDGPNTGRSTLHGSRTPTTTSGRGGGVSPRATTATSPGATKSATATTTTTSSSSPAKLELSDEMAIFLFKRCGARAVGSELAATTNSGNVASGGGEDGRDDLRLSLDMWDKAMQLHRIRLRLPPAPIMEDARQLIASMCAAANNGGGRGVAADNALIDVEIFRTIVEDQFRQASKYVEVGGLRGDARLQPLRPATAPTNSNNNNNNTEYALPVFCYPERPPLSLAMVLAAINPSELVKPLRHGEVVRFLRCVGLVDVSLRAIVHQQELAVKQQARGMMMAGSPTRSGNNTNRSTSAAPTTAEELLWGSQAPPRSGSTAITHTEAGEGVVGEMSSSLEEEDRPHPARLARRMQRAKLEHQRAANNRVGRMPDYSYVKSRYQYPSPHLDEISRSVIARAKARRLMQELRTRAIPIHRFEWYARAEAPPDHSEIPTDLMKGHHLLQESESASIADSDALPNLDKLLLPPRNGKQKHHHDARYDQAQQDAPRQPRPQHHNPYRGAKTASFLPSNNPRCYALSGTQPAARATPSTFERLGRPQCDPRVYSFLLTQPYALESLAAAAKRPATGLRPIGADSPRARDVAEPATLTDEDLHQVYQPHRPRSKGRPEEVRRRRRKLAGQQQQQQQTSRRTRSSAASSSKQRPQTGGQRAGSPKLRATRTNTPSSTSTTPMHGAAAATTAAAPRRPASDCQAASSANDRRPPRRPLTSSSRNNNNNTNNNTNQPGSEEEPMPTVLCSTLEVQQKRRADIYARRIRELQGEFEYRQTLRMEREGKRRGGRTSANATPSAATRTTSSSRGGSHGSLPPRAATDGVDESSSNNPTTSSTPTAGATTASAKKKLGPTRTTPTAAERRQPSMPPLAPRRRPSPSHPTGSFHVRSASASEQHSAASSEPTTPSSIATSPSTNAFVLEKLARAQPSSMDGGGPPRKKALPAAKTAATPPTRATSTKKEAPSTTKKKNIIAKPPTTDTTSTEAESAETSAEPTPFVDDAASPPPPASSTTTAAACADPSPLSEPAYLQHVDSSNHDDDDNDDDGAEGEEEQKQPQPQEEEEEGEEHRSQQHSHREFVSYASSDVQSGMISPALVSRRVIDHTQAPTTGDHQSLYYDRGGAVDAEEYDSGLVEEPPAVVLAPTEYEDMYGYEPYNLHNVQQQQQQHNDDEEDDDDRGRQEDEKELCSTDSANSFVEAAAAAAAGGGARRSSSPASASHSSAVIPPSPTHEDDPSANNNNNSAFEGRTGRSTPSLEQHVSLLSHASSRTPLSGPRQRPGSRSPHASPRLIFSASGGGGGEAAIGPDWSGTSSAGAAAGRPHGSPMPPMANNNNNNNVGEDGRPPRIPT